MHEGAGPGDRSTATLTFVLGDFVINGSDIHIFMSYINLLWPDKV